MVAMHLSLFEVLVNSRASRQRHPRKEVGVSLEQINEIIAELQEPK